MSADYDVDLASFEIGKRLLLLGGRAEARQHIDARWKRSEAAFEGFEMLEGKNGRGRENRDLLAVADGFKSSAHGDLGLAITDISAEEAVHGDGALHIALDIGDGGLLVLGFLKLEGVFEFALEVAVGSKR